MAENDFYVLSALDRCACTEEWRALRENLSSSSLKETNRSCNAETALLAACGAAQGSLPLLVEKYQKVAAGLYAAEVREEADRRESESQAQHRKKEGCEFRIGQNDNFRFSTMLADLIGFCPSLIDSHVRPLFRGGLPLPVELRERIWMYRLDPTVKNADDCQTGIRGSTLNATSSTSDVDHIIRRLAKFAIASDRAFSREEKKSTESDSGKLEEKLVRVSRIVYLEAQETKPFRPETVSLAHLFTKVFATDSAEIIATRLSFLFNDALPFHVNNRWLPLTSPNSARGISRNLIASLDPLLRSNLLALDGSIPNAEAWNALHPETVVNKTDSSLKKDTEGWQTNQPEMEFLARRFGLSAVIQMSEKAAASVSCSDEKTEIAGVWRFWTAEEMVTFWLCRGFIGVLAEECVLYCWDQCFLHGFQLLPAFAAVVLRLLRVPIAHAASSLQGELEQEHEGLGHTRSDALGAVRYAFLVKLRQITLEDLVKAVRNGKGSGVVNDGAGGWRQGI